jgi:hypothetical protein
LRVVIETRAAVKFIAVLVSLLEIFLGI